VSDTDVSVTAGTGIMSPLTLTSSFLVDGVWVPQVSPQARSNAAVAVRMLQELGDRREGELDPTGRGTDSRSCPLGSGTERGRRTPARCRGVLLTDPFSRRFNFRTLSACRKG
jgi:hypothetical protein